MDPHGDFSNHFKDFNTAYASGDYDVCSFILTQLKTHLLQNRNANQATIIPQSLQQNVDEAGDFSKCFADYKNAYESKDYVRCDIIFSQLENSVAQKRNSDQQQIVGQAGQAADQEQNALQAAIVPNYLVQFEEFDHFDFDEEVEVAQEPNSPQPPVLLEELDLGFDGFAGLDEQLGVAEEPPLDIPMDNLADIDFLNLENDGVVIVEEDLEDLGNQAEDGMILVGGQANQDDEVEVGVQDGMVVVGGYDVHEDDEDDDDEMYQEDDDEETDEEDEDEQTDEEDELDPDQLENLPPKRVITPSSRLLQSA